MARPRVPPAAALVTVIGNASSVHSTESRTAHVSYSFLLWVGAGGRGEAHQVERWYTVLLGNQWHVVSDVCFQLRGSAVTQGDAGGTRGINQPRGGACQRRGRGGAIVPRSPSLAGGRGSPSRRDCLIRDRPPT